MLLRSKLHTFSTVSKFLVYCEALLGAPLPRKG